MFLQEGLSVQYIITVLSMMINLQLSTAELTAAACGVVTSIMYVH